MDDDDGSDEPKPKKKAAPRRKKKVHAFTGVLNNDLPYHNLSRLIRTKMPKSQALTMRVAQTTAQARNVSAEEPRRAPGKGLQTMTISALFESRQEYLSESAILTHTAGSISFTIGQALVSVSCPCGFSRASQFQCHD
jgi:hypothetical protein